MLKSLLKLFGGGSAPASASGSAMPKVDGLEDLENFVVYIVRSLVDNPRNVRIETDVEGDSHVIRINCDKEDIGKVVGKRGKTIMAIRSLVSGAAGRLQKRVTVEVVD